MADKRYVASVEFYIWADNDQKALNELQLICALRSLEFDDDCSPLSLAEQPFGELGSRPVNADLNTFKLRKPGNCPECDCDKNHCNCNNPNK